MAKILVVDDEENICSELAEILEEDRHEVECAQSAAEAFKKIKSTTYHLIFLDILIPKLDGTEALLEIKKKTKTPVVMMSAYLAPEIERKVLEAGAFACLKKPFKLKEIKALIEKIIQQKKV